MNHIILGHPKKASSNFSQRWRNAVENNSILASAKAISEKLLAAEMKQDELRQQLKKKSTDCSKLSNKFETNEAGTLNIKRKNIRTEKG
jgi:hypothetical protein